MPSTIDVEADDLVTVRDIARQKLGRDVCQATVWRWVRKGAWGVRLQAVSVRNTWYTTPAAFAAFINEQTAAQMAEPLPERGEIPPITPEIRERINKI